MLFYLELHKYIFHFQIFISHWLKKRQNVTQEKYTQENIRVLEVVLINAEDKLRCLYLKEMKDVPMGCANAIAKSLQSIPGSAIWNPTLITICTFTKVTMIYLCLLILNTKL